MTCASLAVSVFTLDDSGLLTHHLDLAAGFLRGPLRLLRAPTPAARESITPTTVRLAFLRIHPLRLRA